MSRPGQGFGFWLRGIEPAGDLAYQLAGPAGHRRFWANTAEIARERYAIERKMGIGVDGADLTSLSPVTIANRRSAMGAADPTAPPFIPAYSLSRTISLLRPMVTDTGVWFTWGRDPETGLPWGQVLYWHATGQTSAPARNVIGISPAGLEWVRVRAIRWWKINRTRVAGRQLARQITPKTGMKIQIPQPSPPPSAEESLRRLKNMDLHTGDREQIERSIRAGTFSGFRRFGPDDGPRGLDRLRRRGGGPSPSGPGRPPTAPRPLRTGSGMLRTGSEPLKRADSLDELLLQLARGRSERDD